MSTRRRTILAAALLAALAHATLPARADAQRRGRRADVQLPTGARLVADVAYGSDPAQRFDVYVPANAHGAPIVFMVHGGGWRNGDKAHGRFAEHKVERWVPRGFVVVSTNYRMLPGTPVSEQARDVARALAAVQRRAAEWGGDGTKVITMGHSAGAHLVALLASQPAIMRETGAGPVLGTVSIESASIDVVRVMEHRHARLFDDAFGKDRDYWVAMSPLHQLRAATAPVLAICSTTRPDTPCEAAHHYEARARSLGMRAEVLHVALSHAEANEQLGTPGKYTTAVEAFMHTLDPAVARALDSAPAVEPPAARRGRPRRSR